MAGVRLYKKKQDRQGQQKAFQVERRSKPRVICPYCITRAVLITGAELYPHRADLHHKNFWRCNECMAYVGCHAPNPSMNFKGDEPLGKLANAAVRLARLRAHNAFDKVWKEGKNARSFAYMWLSDHMNIKPDKCHIGMMDIAQCNEVIRLVQEQYGE